MTKVLILKKMKFKIEAKVRKRESHRFAPDDYVKVFNPHDPNDLALLFEDLAALENAPIEKAFRKFKEARERPNPFF